MNVLEAKDLTYQYEDGTTALQGVNLNIEKGLTTAVIGGNGSGKSTLFLSFNGILKPHSGQVLFEGREIRYDKKSLYALRQQVGIVFQNSDEQLFSANVKKDVAFGLVNMGMNPQETEGRLQEVIEKTGIRDFLQKPTHALSFGQKKRVAIAGIVAMHPSVIILDEPTAGLDPSGVSEILELLQSLKKLYGITVILSTHEIDLVPLYCDRVILLSAGQVVFSGTPRTLCENPQLLRSHHLRLPRIAHLMEILHEKDKLPVDKAAATIKEARKTIGDLIGNKDE